MSTSDTHLLERWQQHRDADAFTELIQRYAGVVYSASRRMLHDTALAEDVAQECFMELMESSTSVRSSLGAWLHTMAVRRSMDRIKGDARRRAREAHFAEADASTTQPDAALDEILQAVDEAITTLPAQQQDVIVDRFLEGKSHVELGKALDLSESTIRYRIDKAISAIRSALRKQGIVVGAAALTTVLSESAMAAPHGLITRLGKLSLSGAVGGTVATGAGSRMILQWGLGLLVLACAGTALLWSVTQDQGPSPDTIATASPSLVEEVESSMEVVAPAPEPVPESGLAAVVEEVLVAPIEGDTDFVLRGKVLDADTGEPVPDVKVRVSPSGGGRIQNADDATGADGVYTFSELEPGAWEVSVENPSKYPRALSVQRISIQLAEGEVRDNVNFNLKSGICITGRILDRAGNPVADAHVGGKSPSTANPYRTKSDETGHYALYMARPSNNIWLQAYIDTAESTTKKDIVLTEDGLEGIDLTLDVQRDAAISGKVLDHLGEGVAKANVYLRHTDDRVFTSGGQERCSRNGRFHFAVCAPGNYSVIVTPEGANGYSTREEYARITIAPGEKKAGLEIVFGDKGGEAIAGRILKPDGTPLSRAEVTIYSEDMQRSYSDRDGKFILTGLEAEKEYSVNVEHYEYSTFWSTYAAGTLDVEITLQEQGSFAGQVVDDATGEPITEFSYGLTGGKGGAFSSSLYVFGNHVQHAEGRFSRDKLRAGESTFAVWAPGYAPAIHVLKTESGEESQATFRLKTVPAITGLVQDSQGNPVADAQVYFAEGFAAFHMDQCGMVKSNAAGEYNLTTYPPEAKRLMAYKPGYAIGVMELPGNGVITLPQPVTISGAVHNAPSTPDQTNVNYYYEGQQHLLSDHQRLGEDSTFHIDTLSPGFLTVSVFPNAHKDTHFIKQQFQAEAGKSYPLEFNFQRGTAALTIQITEGGQPREQAWLTLIQEIPGGTQELRGRQDNTGLWRFERVWSGPLILEISRMLPDQSDAVKDSFALTLSDDEVLHQDIDLEPLE